MREYPKAMFSALKQMFVDTDHALHESGDLMDPIKSGWISENQIFTLGKLITKRVSMDVESTGTTLFKSVGMALFDLIVSDLIYEKAVQKKLGKDVDL
jgi:ornithine cyclodeaminase